MAVTEPVTVIINNCNLLTWPRAMVGEIESFSSLAEILVVDNGSTYPPLLDWYATLPHEVVRLANIGHKAPWMPEVKARVKTRHYAVTDPDLDLAATPRDCLDHLRSCLERYPAAGKVGLGLRIDDVPANSPWYPHVNDLEKSYWQLPLLEGGVRPAPVDTTFAIYDKKLLDRHEVCGGRTDTPYTARHLPWYLGLDQWDAEFTYYIEHATRSSSYRALLTRR